MAVQDQCMSFLLPLNSTPLHPTPPCIHAHCGLPRIQVLTQVESDIRIIGGCRSRVGRWFRQCMARGFLAKTIARTKTTPDVATLDNDRVLTLDNDGFFGVCGLRQTCRTNEWIPSLVVFEQDLSQRALKGNLDKSVKQTQRIICCCFRYLWITIREKYAP